MDPLDPVGADARPLPPCHEPLLQAIAAAAADSDRLGVPRTTIEALGAAGLLGSPLQPPALQRELAERLFMADGSLAFCWLQHQLPLRRLQGAESGPEAPGAGALRQQWLEPLASGRALAAVAFAHLRRPGPPDPLARRVRGGWQLDGQLDWITSWDIADRVLLCLRCAAVDHDGDGDGHGDAIGDQVVGLLLPAGHAGEPLPAGLELGEPLALLAMGGTHTRPVRLEGVVVPESQVLFLEDFQSWSRHDAAAVARVSPVVFGCIRGAIADLAAVARRHHDATGLALAAALTTECRRLRRCAYALIDSDPDGSPELPPRHRQLRAAALELAMRSAQAAVIAHAGGAMHRDSEAGRRLREASFLLVQAQSGPSRQASQELLLAATAAAAAGDALAVAAMAGLPAEPAAQHSA